MNGSLVIALSLATLLGVVSCQRETSVRAAEHPASAPEEGLLLSVGTVSVTQSDLDHYLGEHPNISRDSALATLTDRARLTQAAVDAGLANDPLVRAEFSRILVARLRETGLDPKLRALAAEPIPEVRLREIYESRKDRFQTDEKRQVAMLWLDPGDDPERAARYKEKLNQAREWLLASADLLENPDQGFSVLSVDHSEHAPSRFKQGIVGWLGRQEGPEPLATSAARIAFTLGEPGDVSEVVSCPEGLFLVRLMATKPAVVRSFESVSAELEREERDRMLKAAEAEFLSSVMSRHPSGPSDEKATLSRITDTP